MLLLSSITTATMFCCGRKVAMLNAGCHSRNSNRQISKLWRIQTTALRGPRMVGAITRRRLQITQPSPAAAISRSAARVHTGHWLRSTKLPLAKTVGGYLKRNSNIGSGHYRFSSALSISCYLMLGVRRGKFGYRKEDRSQNSESRSQNSEARMPGARPCGKTQLRRDAAPFDSKSMLFLQQYDSMGI